MVFRSFTGRFSLFVFILSFFVSSRYSREASFSIFVRRSSVDSLCVLFSVFRFACLHWSASAFLFVLFFVFSFFQVFQGGNWLHLHDLLSLSSGDQVLLEQKHKMFPTPGFLARIINGIGTWGGDAPVHALMKASKVDRKFLTGS